MKRKRAFIYVQHLLGIGHLRRAATIANALAVAGLKVTLASGGSPVKGLLLKDVKFFQLPPASAQDASFKVLVRSDGTPVDDAWKARRQGLLLEAWRAAAPHVLMLELYPFGRRQMRFELIPLLEAASCASNRPFIVSSVRDLLGGGHNNLAKQESMLEIFERFFDRVLVHSDPAIIPFGLTFMHADRIEPKTSYTGYVVDKAVPAPDEAPGRSPGDHEVIVSAGGGAVGMRLLETAIRSRPYSRLALRTWRILAGVNASNNSLDALAALADSTGAGRVQVERARPDFKNLLARCAVSVSQGGYNTMMEIVQAGARAVVIPFSGGAEIEQTLRARAFAEHGLVATLQEDALTPMTLAAAIDQTADRVRPLPGAIDLHGARRTAELVGEWAANCKW